MFKKFSRFKTVMRLRPQINELLFSVAMYKEKEAEEIYAKLEKNLSSPEFTYLQGSLQFEVMRGHLEEALEEFDRDVPEYTAEFITAVLGNDKETLIKLSGDEEKAFKDLVLIVVALRISQDNLKKEEEDDSDRDLD